MASGKSDYQAWKFRVIRILKEKGLLTATGADLDKSNSKAISRDNVAFTISVRYEAGWGGFSLCDRAITPAWGQLFAVPPRPV